ncbi:unnamed protein product [Symbiodinium necroappetens]|uniref:Uncharacterized protein n=1 Tax=Symbiodinium necroappetens TaxID=1628268 RepID=A0A812P5Q3_9DINO|nr:unnamed protein product [Symbiodinium necroappetens]
MSTLPYQVMDLRDATCEALCQCSKLLEDSDDPWLVVEVFEKLREWLRRDFVHVQKLLDPLLEVRALQALRRFGTQNLEVARLGLGVIAGFCQRNDNNTEFMVTAGFVEELVKLMDLHREDGTVQDNACVAVWRLAERHSHGAERVVETDGLRRVLTAMKDHRRNSFVQVNALLALEKLGLKGVVPRDGFHHAAHEAMKFHPRNLQVRRAALRVKNLEPRRVEHESEMIPSSCSLPMKADALSRWLLSMDSYGFLMEYHARLRQYQTPAEVAGKYIRNGRLLNSLFVDLGVRKLGHRRLFERWCRDWVGSLASSDSRTTPENGMG